MRRLALGLALCLLVSGLAWGGDAIYYRRNEDGTLVITNVPDRRDLKVLRPESRRTHPQSGAKFRDLIYRTAEEHGIHPELVYAVAAVESSFDPLARSIKGAQGLMQLMPETAARFGVDDAYNPAQNVRGGVRFLRYLLDMFNGDVRLALAAYNAGENVVLALGRVPPYPETRNYVAKIMKRFGPGRPPHLDQAPDEPAEAAEVAADTQAP
jgi:soluble lytic murein transglycosylase-like protein